ncbi:hypothetical protein JCGZ_08920 [Jatropha curcas]|uniref:Uncharacterized protein n=1 Tax=Jatropha curcas TaxID=180498 RepID=A0A067LEW3_JATCU|nr:hypothetical protein JCGZ_08920 [Jatropha curcas]
MMILGEFLVTPNAGSRVTKIKDVSRVSDYKKEDFVRKIVKKLSADKQGSIECSNLTESMKWLYKLIVHYIYPKSASLTYVNQNNPKKLPYGMILTPVFEFLNVNLDEHVGSSVSKLDSGSLKMKDEEEEKEKKEKEEKEEKMKEEKEKEEIEKQKKVKKEAEKKKEKGKGKLEEIVKEERKSEEKEEEKKSAEKAEEEEEGTQEEELEEERKEETEKESTVEKEESEKETRKIEEPEKSEKGKKVEEGSDAETEKLEISDEEKTTEDKTEQESELLSAQRSRKIMLGRIEKELIEEHNKEIDEAIQQCQTIIEQNQSLVKTLEKMKDVNMRKLATLKVKGTPYVPSSEKPKNVKHIAGKHRTHGRKPPLHPSSKRTESSSETAPAQPLRSSKRLRTGPKPL